MPKVKIETSKHTLAEFLRRKVDKIKNQKMPAKESAQETINKELKYLREIQSIVRAYEEQL